MKLEHIAPLKLREMRTDALRRAARPAQKLTERQWAWRAAVRLTQHIRGTRRSRGKPPNLRPRGVA